MNANRPEAEAWRCGGCIGSIARIIGLIFAFNASAREHRSTTSGGKNMKIVLMLFCCALLALAIMALPSHQAAAATATAATNPYTPSADLADAMSSHGIEAAGPGNMESVVYRPGAGSQ